MTIESLAKARLGALMSVSDEESHNQANSADAKNTRG